jgi:hypothetical protein
MSLDATGTVPSDIPTGTYHLLFAVDADHQIAESDETNNIASCSPVQVIDPLLYADDFSSTLANWVEKDPDNLGSWSIQGGALIGDYNIGCGSPGCHQTDLLLADQYQPGNQDWRMEVRSGLVQAYCCYNGGAMVNLAKFSLWVSNTEKEDIEVGKGWQGLQAPASMTSVDVGHQAYPWHGIGSVTTTVPAWTPSQWQTAVLEKRGNQYTLYFNGVQVYSVTRTFSSAPKIGFRTYGMVKMDDFKLYTLP